MNAGIEAALARRADHVMLLNNDTVVEPDFLEPLVEALELDEPAAAACSQIGVPRRAGEGLVRRCGLQARTRAPRHQPGVRSATPGRDSPAVHNRPGLRRCDARSVPTCLADVGLFDESLFAYAEDTDWSLRAARRGRHVLVVPASVVRHAVSESSGGASSPDTLYYALRNGLVVAERWAPRGPVGTWARRAEAVAAYLAQAPTLRPPPRGSTGRPRRVARLQARTVRPAPPDVGSRCGDGSSRTG